MLKIKPELVKDILASLVDATSVNEALAMLISGSNGNPTTDSRKLLYAQGQQQTYDLMDLINRYGNFVKSLTILFGKLLTVPAEAVKDLTPQLQTFMDKLVAFNDEIFEEHEEN